MARTGPRELARMVARAISDAGMANLCAFTVEQHKHQRVVLKVGEGSRFVVCASTPGDHRNLKNIGRYVRRALVSLGGVAA